MIEYFLWSTNLLNEAILHYNDSITQSHSFSLIMSYIDESSIDSLSQLDNLSSHLVTQFGIQVR